MKNNRDNPQKIIWEKICFEKITLNSEFSFNPQAPVAQNSADEVVFRHFQVEGVEFL